MATPIPPQSTPDDHIATLVEMAQHFENAADGFADNGVGTASPFVKKWRRYAAAIRWLMAETAHGVDAEELAG